MNIILFGPPGAGKGTQADNIANNFNLKKISSGDLLRNEIANNSDLGNTIKTTIDKGDLVSDNIINKLIENILSDKRFFNRILLDGYPRNITQAKKLDFLINKYNQKISCVFSLDVDKETIIKRILGRQTCTKCGMIFNEFFKPSTKENHLCDNIFLQKRSDDNEKTIINRYETYINKTVPILNFYQDQNMLYRVNGIVEIDQIYKEICDIISSLEA